MVHEGSWWSLCNTSFRFFNATPVRPLLLNLVPSRCAKPVSGDAPKLTGGLLSQEKVSGRFCPPKCGGAMAEALRCLTRLEPRLPGTIQRHAFRLRRCCASQVVQLREHLVPHGEKKRRAWGRMLAREGATRAAFDQSCGRKPEQSARRRDKSARYLGCTDAISPSMRARATRAASSSAANALARRVCCAQANLSTICIYGCRRG